MRRLLILSPVATLIAVACAVAMLAGTRAPAPPDTTTDPVTLVSQTVAQRAVADWIDTGGLPAGADVLALVGTTCSTATTSDTGDPVHVTTCTHTFSVSSATAVVAVSVSVAYNESTHAYAAIGAPSVTLDTHTIQAATSAGAPWVGVATTTCPDTILPAVEAWATAFFSGSPTKLQQAVADADPAHHYVPMVGAAIAQPATRACAMLDPGAKIPSTLVASITVPLRWPTPAPLTGPAATASPDYTQVGFDVRVDAVNTPAPVVTAWGPVGTGMTLARYQNASPVAVSVVAPSAVPPTARPATPEPAHDTPTEPSGEPS